MVSFAWVSLALAVGVSATACAPRAPVDSREGLATMDPPAAAAAPSGAPGPVDFDQPINAVGTEPFWAVEIRPGSLSLSGPDRETLTAPNGGPRIEGPTAVWEAVGPDGAPLKVSLTTETCSDGMSDLAYPLRARIETTSEMLNGCAAPLNAWPRETDAPN